MKIAVTGGTGLLGIALGHSLRGTHEVALIGNTSTAVMEGCASSAADIANRDSIHACLARIGPDAVVHAAAQTNVDYCEDHWKEAVRENVDGSANVASYCAKAGAKMVAVSTDYVFDGTKSFYTEDDSPHPLGRYAQSKLLGEQAARAETDDLAIVRTTMYGWNHRGKKNYAMYFLENLQAGNGIEAFADQFNTPMLANDLADAIKDLLERDSTGLFHAGCQNRVSRVQFAQTLASVFNLDGSLVAPINIREKNFKSPRPPDASLDSSKLQNEIGRQTPTLSEGLGRFRQLIESGYKEEAKIVIE
ncbi:SDR family oxidoreductase [Candidatus Micrarchaeota archaeon]|nr:SDR family oxidoreductase [Candidatus Micrarchaeota archaeon]